MCYPNTAFGSPENGDWLMLFLQSVHVHIVKYVPSWYHVYIACIVLRNAVVMLFRRACWWGRWLFEFQSHQGGSQLFKWLHPIATTRTRFNWWRLEVIAVWILSLESKHSIRIIVVWTYVFISNPVWPEHEFIHILLFADGC